jgi:hypothetical protein
MTTSYSQVYLTICHTPCCFHKLCTCIFMCALCYLVIEIFYLSWKGAFGVAKKDDKAAMFVKVDDRKLSTRTLSTSLSWSLRRSSNSRRPPSPTVCLLICVWVQDLPDSQQRWDGLESEGIYIHVDVLEYCSALLLNVPGEELTDGLFSFLIKRRKRRLFQTPR